MSILELENVCLLTMLILALVIYVLVCLVLIIVPLIGLLDKKVDNFWPFFFLVLDSLVVILTTSKLLSDVPIQELIEIFF